MFINDDYVIDKNSYFAKFKNMLLEEWETNDGNLCQKHTSPIGNEIDFFRV